MKKNFNPYTVPERFFEENRSRIVKLRRKKARVLRYAFISAAAVALLVLLPVFSDAGKEVVDTPMKDTVADNLAQMYNCDIFLQVNF